VSTRHKSFWSTIPGLITGVAGILTGVVGLGTLLVQLGVVGDNGGGGSTTKTGPGVTSKGGSGTGSQGGSATTSFTVDPPAVKLSLTDKSATVTVRNTGSAPLELDQPQLGGSNPDQFTVSSGSCTANDVRVGGSCTMTVTFKGGLAATATMTLSASGASSHQVTLQGSLLATP
jgi:hypothetical protein